MTQESWREVRLGEVAKLEKQAWHPGDEELPYIGLEHIEEQTLRLKGVGNSSMVESNKFRFESGNILFGKLRPYFRKVVMPTFEGVCSTDIWVIAPKEQATSEYLFYLLANQEFIDLAYSSSSGTRMPRADWDFLSETVWPLPPLPEQKRIAEVLSSLDDKIDLLHRQNKTLEDTAQLLFQQWFYKYLSEDENKLPAGWRIGELREISEISSGQRPVNKSDEKNKINKIPLIGASKIMGYVQDYLYTDRTLVLGRVGTHGVVQKFNEPIWASDNTLVIKSENYMYVYLTLKNINYEKMNRGGVQPLITQTDLRATKAIVPSQNYFTLFKEKTNPMLEKIESNTRSIEALKSLRDLLIPQLIRGKIRVKIFDLPIKS